MSSDSNLPLLQEDVDSLRQLVDRARAEGGLDLSRQEISSIAGIRATDLDNFLQIDRRTKTYRSLRPHDRVLRRLIAFVATDARFASLAEREDAWKATVDRMIDIYRSFKRYSPDDDHFFLHLHAVKAMDEESCKAICRSLSGKYYGYRYSINAGRIIKSHFEIHKYDPTRKLPNFTHRLKFRDGIQRVTTGQILEIGGSFMFVGFVSAGNLAYDGIKCVVIRKGNFGSREIFKGPFISYAGNGVHEIGFIQLARTEDKFDLSKIGEFSVEDLRSDKLFDADALRQNISTQRDGEFLIGALALNES